MSCRVAYVALEPFPSAKGSGTRIAAMLGALVSSGRQVHLLTLPARDTAEAPPGVTLHPLAVLEPNFLARALAFRDQVARRLQAIRPDVVHFRGVFEGQAALGYAALRRIPAIFEANGLPSVELPYHYPAVGTSPAMLARLRALEARTLGAADAVITQSRTTLAYLCDHGKPHGTPSFVIPNAADPDAGDAGQAPSEPPTVLYAGTLAPWQGVAELVMAARRTARERSLRFVLAGPARRRWELELRRLLRRLGLESVVSLAGALDRPSLARAVAGAALCVAPLRRDHRNAAQGCSPIKLYEYMAAGRPVLVTDLPCVREIVTPERGELVAAPRPKLLAERILALLDDPGRRRALGLAARAWVREHATWQHRAAALQAVYASLGS
ncbi:MAG: glycosyltransferase family 4 protein [Myxococcales bacterium]|nr:glycosyltransferase family 4 protein [Myxococcales bacterium]